MIRGVLAGAAGTALMETVWYARYRREGGTSGLLEWETAAGLDSFQDAPAPAQVGKRVAEGLLQRELGPLVWSTAYLVLRPTGISKPMRDYDARPCGRTPAPIWPSGWARRRVSSSWPGADRSAWRDADAGT